MKMKFSLWYALSLLLLMFGSEKISAFDCCEPSVCCEAPCGGWHALAGGGYATSMKAGIKVGADWDFAFEGYNDDLGGSPFFYIGFGKQFCNCFNLDVTCSYYQAFHYQKYQTGISPTPGFSGPARTRFFDLNHENVMFDLILNPNWSCVCTEFCGLRISPFVGIGIGVGIHHLNNFYTVGFNDDLDVGVTTVIGFPVLQASFAWRIVAALKLQSPCSPFSFDIGYRYYDGGCFRGPSEIVSNSNTFSGGFASVSAWEGKLKTNEVFLGLGFKF